jgi:hypothetical protein
MTAPFTRPPNLFSFREILAAFDVLKAEVQRRAASSSSDDLVCLKDAAHATGLSCDTIVRRIRADPSLGRQIGGRWFVSLQMLIEAEAPRLPDHLSGSL